MQIPQCCVQKPPPGRDSRYKRDAFWNGEGARVVLQSHAFTFKPCVCFVLNNTILQIYAKNTKPG